MHEPRRVSYHSSAIYDQRCVLLPDVQERDCSTQLAERSLEWYKYALKLLS